MWRKLYSEGQKILDSDSGIAKNLILTYADSFDMIHRYQEQLAHVHTIDYTDYGHIPDELVTLLASQWNWSLIKNSDQSDISEYLYPTWDHYVTGASLQKVSGKEINFERWRRILANLVYLYKKKGTHAGLNFFTNLYGIPERLLSVNEIVEKLSNDKKQNAPNLITAPSKIVVHTANGPKYVNGNTGLISDFLLQGYRNTKWFEANISPFDAID